MGASVADDMIRSYFDRWQRLEEEKRTISDDLKELFAEARGNGLDTKALRAVFREQVGDKAAIEEFDAICDLYRASLNAPRAGRAREAASYAEAKGRDGEQSSHGKIPVPATTLKASNAKASSAETGELATTPSAFTDTQEQPETANEVPAQDGSGTATGESPSGKSHAAHPVSEQELADADLNDGTAAGQTAIEVVTAGETASHSPSPDAAPRLAIADDEAAQANPTSSAPIQSAADLLPGAVKAGDVPPPEWRPVGKYEGLYEVSDTGLVRNANTGNLLSQFQTDGGYFIVKLFRDNVGKNHKVHRLVATAFIRPPVEDEEVNHIDFDKAHNVASNLEWVTSQENIAHFLDANPGFNTQNRGFSEDQVHSIRLRVASGESKRSIARDLSVAKATIDALIAGQTYSGVSPATLSEAEIPAFLRKKEKKDCLKLKDGHCKISFDTPALCAVCNAERMKARAA